MLNSSKGPDMKRVLKTFAAVSALSILGASVGQAQDLGGFPIREPGGGVTKPAGHHGQIVSKANGSRVTTVAAAMKLIKPGGTILVQGGTYNENLVLTKPVSIRGVPDAYGRNVVFRPSPDRACVTVAPDTPYASVNLSGVVFKFDASSFVAPCIDVTGGNFTLQDSFIIPGDADIPLRAAYGQLLPEVYDHIASPPRDNPNGTYRRGGDYSQGSIEDYRQTHARHAQSAGANNAAWQFMTGGTDVEGVMHARSVSATGVLSGPSAGVRVSAGDVRLVNNVIIGTKVGVYFNSHDGARISGKLNNNVLLGNGMGVDLKAVSTDLVLANNTIRYNYGAGIKADIYDGLQIISNEISGNQTGIDLAAKVRMVNITSNLIVNNNDDAIKASSGFNGLVSANTIAGNGGCTVQFYSAEQKILNNNDVKLVAYTDFQPILNWEGNNYAVDNSGDYVGKPKRGIFGKRNRKRSKNIEPQFLNACGSELKS